MCSSVAQMHVQGIFSLRRRHNILTRVKFRLQRRLGSLRFCTNFAVPLNSDQLLVLCKFNNSLLELDTNALSYRQSHDNTDQIHINASNTQKTCNKSQFFSDDKHLDY